MHYYPDGRIGTDDPMRRGGFAVWSRCQRLLNFTINHLSSRSVKEKVLARRVLPYWLIYKSTRILVARARLLIHLRWR